MRWLALLLLLIATPAAAQEEEEPEVDRARALFVEGADHASAMRWGDALDRFEASADMQPHAGTTYNIGICYRALGRYTVARRAFSKALAQHEAGDGELDATLLDNTKTYLAETERVLATLEVTLSPASARIAVDGRPLQKEGATLVAGLAAAGPGAVPPKARFTMVVDPGPHVIVVSRKGYEDIVVRRTVAPGSEGALDLVLERLPGELKVRASTDRAAVALDGVDVGYAPVIVSRPAGRYSVSVQRDGFERYETDVTLRAAEQTALFATLVEEEPGVHERWWFWAGIGAAVATAAVVTYFVVRPEPERPPLNGGGLGWAIRVP